MTTLYRPVLIETVEQAESLPEGTIITKPDYFPQEKFGGLWGRHGNTSEQLAKERGWTALVPVEAEEEHLAEYAVRADYEPDRMVRRYVTPWEAVS